MSRRTRRRIRQQRVRLRRLSRPKTTRWLPVRWSQESIAATAVLGFVIAFFSVLSIAYAPAYAWIAGLTLPVLFAYLALMDLATRPFLGRSLLSVEGYDFRHLYREARWKGPKPARQHLRDLCEEATLEYLKLEAAYLTLESPDVQEAMGRRHQEAEKLSDRIVEFEQNRPEDPKVVAQRLKTKLLDQERQARQDAIRAQALAALRVENALTAQMSIGGSTCTQEIIDELAAQTTANTEVASLCLEL